MNLNNISIAVIGQGYVGLPLVVKFGKKFNTIGFNIKRMGKIKHHFPKIKIHDASYFPY